jgi:glycosyltransferase involved in cell wall biosynthesis
MRLIYVQLSPTFGMHLYTADLATRARAGAFTPGERPGVHVVTTQGHPAACYDPETAIHTPLRTSGTGFSPEGLRMADLRRTLECIADLATGSDGPGVVHFTSVHLWNAWLVPALRQRGIPVIHTLHDLQAHSGVRFGSLIPRWNGLVMRGGAHILVHGERYRRQLLEAGVPPDRVTFSPLLHGFWAYGAGPSPAELDEHGRLWKNGNVASLLFFGRVEAYKGVDTLLAAWPRPADDGPEARLVIAGAWAADLQPPATAPNVELRNRRIADDEALALFRTSDALILPYRDATQSALIAAAYTFAMPVIVTDAGALSEYVVPNVTGLVVPPADEKALAAAIGRVLSDPGRLREMGAAGRAWYERQRKSEAEILTHLYRNEAKRSALRRKRSS